MLCAVNQLFQDTSPSASRLLIDFVGQGMCSAHKADYGVSKVHLLFLGLFLWFFHTVLLTITVEEAKCRLNPERPNPLDVQSEPHAVETATRYRDSSEGDVHEHLLPQPIPEPFRERAEDRDVLPTIQEPILHIRWTSLWTTEAA